MSQLSRGSFVKGADTVLFLVLSIFIVGSVLFGYRAFAIPPSHHAYISCEENCEKIVHESVWQSQHLFNFFKQKPYGWSDTKVDPGIRRPGHVSADEIIKRSGYACRDSHGESLECFVIKIISIVRTSFYNPLYILSGFVSLPFHFVFSLFLILLMIATALLAANISLPPHVPSGKGFFLATQMILFFMTHGRLIVLSFSIMLLLYLFYLPAEEKKKPHNLLLHFPCIVCASLSTGIFSMVYTFYLFQVILQWHSLKIVNRTMGIVIATAFFPILIGAILKNVLYFGNDILILITEHGSLFRWNLDWQLLNSSYSLIMCSVPLLFLLPHFSKKIQFHYYIRSLWSCLALAGIFLGTNFGHVLLLLNSMALKRFLLDGYLFKLSED